MDGDVRVDGHSGAARAARGQAREAEEKENCWSQRRRE